MISSPVFNYNSLDSAVIYHQGRAVSLGEILQTVDYLYAKIPAHPYLLNLYDDRYYFLLGFLLGLKQQSISLFPSTVTSHVLTQLQDNYDDLLVFSELKSEQNQVQHNFQVVDLCELLAGTDFSPAAATEESITPTCHHELAAVMPDIDRAQQVAIVFTSGSTGQPKPYIKQWGDLLIAARYLTESLFAANESPAKAESTVLKALLATVPAQHMYGLEASIMVALQNGFLIHASKPFFPQDITHCLQDFTQLAHHYGQTIETSLITTPLHLKACIKTDVLLPGVKQFVSATAPLPTELAQLCETQYGAPVMEIFGCTEVGSMAYRRTIETEQWTVLKDISLQVIDSHADIQINTARSIQFFPFNDIIELLDERHFILKGRKEDLINLAGKRTSLAYLNHHLQACDELSDACFYQDTRLEQLVTFIVLKAPDEINEKKMMQKIRRYLQQRIESIFLPKKIFFVDQLPRNATGKLPQSELKKLLQQQQTINMPASNLSFTKQLIIRPKHPSLKGHFPDNPVIPAVVILDQLIHLWQQKSNKQVSKINQTKFIRLFPINRNCTIEYKREDKDSSQQQNNSQHIDFLIKDEQQTIIVKGQFSYG